MKDLENKERDQQDAVAPSSQHGDKQDLSKGTDYSKLFDCFNPCLDKNDQKYHLLNDAGILLQQMLMKSW